MNPSCRFALLSLVLLGADWKNHPENRWVLQSPAPDKPAPPFGWEGSGSFDPFSKKSQKTDQCQYGAKIRLHDHSLFAVFIAQ